MIRGLNARHDPDNAARADVLFAPGIAAARTEIVDSHGNAAREFWRRVKLDERIEPGFPDIARGNEDRVLLLMQRIGA